MKNYKQNCTFWYGKRGKPMKKRIFSLLLALVLFAQLLPVPAAAQDTCPHHVHDASCGFSEGAPEVKCSHDCGADCVITELVCTHPEGTDCTSECEKTVPFCAHVCDGACGYQEAVPASACKFDPAACTLCNPPQLNCETHGEPKATCAGCAKEAAAAAAIADVQKMIDALPETVTTENAAQVEAQLTAIDDAMSKYGFGDAEKAKLNAERYVSCAGQLNGFHEPMTIRTIGNGETYTVPSDSVSFQEEYRIEAGGTLIIPSGKSITYNKPIINNGTIVLEGSARLRPSTASSDDSYSGTGTVQCTATVENGYGIAFFGKLDGSTNGALAYLTESTTGTMTLLADAALTKDTTPTYISFDGGNYTLDLSTYTLSIDPKGSTAIELYNGARLTVKGATNAAGTIRTNNPIAVPQGCTFTLESGTIENTNVVAINNMGGIVHIKGGTVTSPTTAVFTTKPTFGSTIGTTNITGGTLSGGDQTLEVENGKLNISGTPTIKTNALTFEFREDVTCNITGGKYPQGITIGGEAGVTLATLIETDSYSYYGADNAVIAATTETSDSSIRSIGAKPVYKITASTTEISFGNLNTSYGSAIPKQTFTVKNESTVAVTLTYKRSSDHFQFEADGSASNLTVELAPGAEHTFTLMPKGSLGVGTYEDTITITGTGGTSVSIKVKFQVSDYTIYVQGFVFNEAVGGKIEHDYDYRFANTGDVIEFRVVPDAGYYLAELKAEPSSVEITKTEEGYSFVMPNVQTVYITPTFKKPTVTFDMNGHGAAISAVTVDAGTAVNAPTAPTAEGYTFAGWYTDKECTDADAYDFTKSVTEDITLYAKWTENKPAHSHDDISYDTEWSGEMAAQTISANTNIVLTDDTAFSGSLTISSGVTVNLCLNGYTLALGENYIINYGTLNICDCSEGETGTISGGFYGIYIGNGTVKVSGGNVSGTTYGIYLLNTNCTLEVSGGSVSGAKYGIYTSGGTVTVSGGSVTSEERGIYSVSNGIVEITNGTVSGKTYGIDNYQCTVTVSGGSVIGSKYGINNSSGVAKISGGSVSGDNTGIQNNRGTVKMSGGSVSGKSYGIYNTNAATVEISSGTVSSTSSQAIYNSSGCTTKISGGTIESSDSNAIFTNGALYLSGSPTIQSKDGVAQIALSSSGKIYATAEQALTSDAYTGDTLGIYVLSYPDDGDVAVYNAKETDGKFTLVYPITFTLAQGMGSNADNLVLYEDGVYTVAFASNGGTDVEHQRVASGNTATEPTAPTNTGFLFGGWFTDEACTNAYDFTAKVTEDITLYAKWTADPSIHAHCICGKHNCTDPSHEKVIFLPWSEVISNTSYISNGGVVQSVNVYLDTDAALTQTIKLVKGSTLNLCLNGHTLNTNDNQFTFPKNTGEKMNLSDCGSGGKITGGETNAPINLGGAIFTMYSGAISGNTARAILVGNTDAKAYILGGTLSGNSTTYIDGGGAICVQKGYLEIGGSAIISGNSTTTRGGAISVHAYSATASMAIGGNAKITGNTAGTFGGAISTSIENGGTIASCTISGNAVISGNRAAYAGALNITQVELVISDNVTITGNTSENATNSSGKTYYGGVYSGKSITISGNVKVYDNLLTTGEQHNLSLVNSDSYLNLVNLGTGAKLGVTRMNNKVPTESAPKVQVSTTGTPADVAKQVKADDPAFEIIHENGAVYMNLHVHAYDQKVETIDYQVDPSAELVCGSTVEYYYSCTCGEKSTEKFSVTKEHVLTYTAENGVITETCGNEGCGHEVTATLSSTVTERVYNGEACEDFTVTYSSQDWLGGDLTVAYTNNVNAGTATASIQKGDAKAVVEFTIAKAAITVTPTEGLSMVDGEAMPELTYTVSGAVNGEVPGFTGKLALDGEGIGTHNITLGDLKLKDNGTFKASNYTLVLSETPVTFTIQSACSVGRHDLVYSLSEPNRPTGWATVTVTEKCLGGCEHEETADFYLTLTSVYTGSPVTHMGFRMGADWKGSQLGYGCYTYSGDRTNVGKPTVTFKYADIEQTYTFEILPATITVTPVAGLSMVDGEAMPELKYTASGAKNGETPAFTGKLALDGEGIGTHNITLGDLALADGTNGFKASNYTLVLSETPVTFTIQSACSVGRHDFVYSANGNVITESCKTEDCDHNATATLSSTVTERVYKGTAYEDFTVTYSSQDWLGGDLTVAYTNNVNAGTATASIQKGDAKAVVEFTISKATLTVTPNAGQTMLYGGTMPELKYTPSGAVKNEVPGFTGALSYSNPENAPLGTFPITLGDLAMRDNGDFKASNYTLALAQEVFTIEPGCDNGHHILRYAQHPEIPSLILETCLGCDHKAAVEVTGYASMQYTGQSMAEKLHVNYTGEGHPEYDVWLGAKDLTVTHGDDVNVGRCDASITYQGATATISFEITPATITVTPDALGKTYGENDPVLTYTVSGAVNGEIPAFEGVLTREAGENTGRYAIEQATLALVDGTGFKASNYTLAFTENVEFTILPKPVEPAITLEYAETTYDGTEKKPAVTLKDGDTVIPASDYEVSYADNVTAGTAIVTIRKKTTGNYDFTTFTASFTIKKAALTVKADDVQIIAGEELALTYAVTGLVSGDTFTNPALTTDAPDNATPGTYTITVSGGTLTNADSYEVTYEDATLTILRRSYNIIKGAGQKVYRGYHADFTSDAPADKLVQVEVDGKTVPAWCYAVSGDDTTKIRFHAEYIKTLRSGEHTLKLVFTNGDAETTFTVRTPLGYYDSDSPKTGDTTNSMLWLSLALVGLAGIAATLLGKKYLMKRK